MNTMLPWLFLIVLATQPAIAETVHSVCEILRNIEKYTDTPIAVRAQWVTGLEQNVLADDQCGGSFPLGSRRWPAAINIRVTQSNQSSHSIQAVNRSISRRLGASWRISPDVRDRLKIMVTAEGILRSVPESGDPTIETGRSTSGFGHLNTFALQLEVASMRAPRFIKRTSKP